MSQVVGEAASSLGTLGRPAGRVVEDLQNLQAGLGLDRRGRIVGGLFVGEAVGRRLDLAPSEPVADPVHSGQRGKIRQPALVRRVVAGEPRRGHVDAYRRVLRRGDPKPRQHRRRGPSDRLARGVEKLDPVPADAGPPQRHAARRRLARDLQPAFGDDPAAIVPRLPAARPCRPPPRAAGLGRPRLPDRCCPDAPPTARESFCGTTAKARQGSGVSVAADGCRAGSDSACPHAGPSGASIAMDSTKSVRGLDVRRCMVNSPGAVIAVRGDCGRPLRRRSSRSELWERMG